MNKKTKANKAFEILDKEFPDPAPALIFSNPLELLIATILSAQATDKLVNKVTPALFRKYKNAKAYADAPEGELEKAISSVNFFNNKARNIRKCCANLVADFNAQVPDNLEDLTSLPGVGRKTANIVLGNAFGINALAVDTHVARVSQRIGLTESVDPDKIEADLCALLAQEQWTKATHLFILHGRATCNAKKPLCSQCKLTLLCDYYAKNK